MILYQKILIELIEKELGKKAKEYGFCALSMTDHNTIEGVEEFLNSAKKLGVEAMPGVEIYVRWKGISLHILGYNFDFQIHSQ